METITLEKKDVFAETLKKIQKPGIRDILKVQQGINRAVHEFMYQKNVIQIMPLMLSPITDPLNHSVVDASIEYANQKWNLTKSMIFHKQLALINPELNSIYIVSPNVRLELADRQDTGRHLFEFTQVDFEFNNKNKEFVMSFMEELIRFVFDYLNNQVPETILKFRGELLPVYKRLATYRTEELEEEYGKEAELKKSLESTEPFWLLNHTREFYDKENISKPGTYLNYDLIWPEGFGEGLSGAEREYEYEQILKRMDETGTDKKVFKNYLIAAKKGILVPSAGAGFGVERMTRFICKLKDIDEVTLFSRKPFSELIF
ncbi:MAG TPA: asparagine synthetase A [Bacteroidia bacterium]|nr:asparagine synthetase A [Bacteroidia bacterium]